MIYPYFPSCFAPPSQRGTSRPKGTRPEGVAVSAAGGGKAGGGAITSLLYLPDGRLAVGTNHVVQLWDTHAPTPQKVLTGLADNALCLALSPDGKTLAVGSGVPTVSGELALFDLKTGALLRRLGKEHKDMVYALAFSPDSQIVISASGDKTLRLWDVKTGQAKGLLRDHADSVYALALSADGKTLASAGVDRSIKLWDLATGKARFNFAGRPHGDTIYALAFAPGENQRLVSVGGDGMAKLWSVGPDAESTEAFRALSNGGQPTYAAAFSPDRTLLATATKASTVTLWSGTGGGWLRTLTGASDWLYATAFSPDSKTVAAAGFAGKVWLWDAATGKSCGTLPPSPPPTLAPPSLGAGGGGGGQAPAKKLAENFASPQGIAYDGKGGVIVASRNGNTINKVNKDGNAVLFTADPRKFTFAKASGLAYGDDNALYACDFGRKAVVRILSDGRTELYADKCDEQGFVAPDTLAFDPEGSLYVLDLTGALYRVEKGSRQVTRAATGLAKPTGLAFAADGKTLYLTDSQAGSVLKATIKPDGSLETPTLFCALPTGQLPRGLAVDQAGSVFVAAREGVLVLSPDGKLTRTLALPGSELASVAFGGKDYKTLYTTDSKTGALYTAEVAVGGLPLFRAPQNEIR